jgi:hypothetical protein
VKRKLFITCHLAICLLLLFSCTEDEGKNLQPQIVVEGWIEDGSFPIVKLTKSVAINEEYQSIDSLSQYMLQWQRVTLSDGTRTVMLSGQYDSHYFPPYIYTTTDMRGEVGRTYTLTISRTDAPDIVAVTTIPPKAVVDSFGIEPVQGDDSLRTVYAYLSVPRGPVSYYKLFTKDDGNSRDFLTSFLGVVRSDLLPPDGKVVLNKGRKNLTMQYNETPHYQIGDTAIVRVARIDSLSYEYWRAYQEMLSLSRVVFFPCVNNMPQEIPDVYGYWQGWGSSYHEIIIK